MSNYLYGSCVLSVEGDANIYSVIPYSDDTELVKNTGYVRDGYVYIYRGDISKKRKYPNGLFSDKKGNRFFILDKDNKEYYSFDRVQDDSIHSIIEQSKRLNPQMKRRIIKNINKSSDIYVPEIDENDDFLKHLIKLAVLEKRVDLKDHKDKFKMAHGGSNLKASLETKSTPDGKRGSLTVNNLLKWLEVLGMQIEVTIKDSPYSDDPCFKEFRYSDEKGYEEIELEGYVDPNQQTFDDEE